MEPGIIGSVAAGLLIWKAIKLGIDLALAKRNKKNCNPGNPGSKAVSALDQIRVSVYNMEQTLDKMNTNIAIILDRTEK